MVKGWPTLPVRWNVKADLVTVIGVKLKKPGIGFSLSLNLATFKRVPATHLGNVFYYKDEKEGFA